MTESDEKDDKWLTSFAGSHCVPGQLVNVRLMKGIGRRQRLVGWNVSDVRSMVCEAGFIDISKSWFHYIRKKCFVRGLQLSRLRVVMFTGVTNVPVHCTLCPPGIRITRPTKVILEV